MSSSNEEEETVSEEHGAFCNCEDCHYARGGEICATCGCLVGAGCPESQSEEP